MPSLCEQIYCRYCQTKIHVPIEGSSGKIIQCMVFVFINIPAVPFS